MYNVGNNDHTFGYGDFRPSMEIGKALRTYEQTFVTDLRTDLCEEMQSNLKTTTLKTIIKTTALSTSTVLLKATVTCKKEKSNNIHNINGNESVKCIILNFWWRSIGYFADEALLCTASFCWGLQYQFWSNDLKKDPKPPNSASKWNRMLWPESSIWALVDYIFIATSVRNKD